MTDLPPCQAASELRRLTDAAGGYAFSGDLARLRAIGLHPKESLDANDSYPLLLKAGTLLRTGPTRTNVMDMAIMLVRPK